MMTFRDFVARASEAVGYNLREDGYLEESWVIGGITGGSCWGGMPDTAVEGEPEPEMTSLDKILEAICPQITYLQYKRICAEVMERSSYRSSDDYYGNYTDWACKRIYLRNLYNALEERGLLDNVE